MSERSSRRCGAATSVAPAANSSVPNRNEMGRDMVELETEGELSNREQKKKEEMMTSKLLNNNKD